MSNFKRKLSLFALQVPLFAVLFTGTVLADDATDEAAAGFSFLLFCCFSIIGLALPLGLAFFVYSDAKKNNIENDVLWALVTFFTGVIGILIYFLVIRKQALEKNAGGTSQPTDTTGTGTSS